jgi:hypothetical protein
VWSGEEKTELLKEKYTVLELDTFLVNGQEIKAYCTLEQISLSQLSQIDPMRTLHHTLIKSYGQQDWKTCLDNAETLIETYDDETLNAEKPSWQRCCEMQHTDHVKTPAAM